MLTPRNTYFAGVTLLTLAAGFDAGIISALITSGVALLVYGFSIAVVGR